MKKLLLAVLLLGSFGTLAKKDFTNNILPSSLPESLSIFEGDYALSQIHYYL